MLELRGIELNEDNIKEFYQAAQIKESEYKSFVSKQNERIGDLNTRFGLNEFSLENLTAEVDVLLEDFGYYNNVEKGSNCWRRYRNALAINFGVAAAAHVGCIAGDVTIILGAICHSAVTLVHYAANDDAFLDYQDCMK